MKLKSMTSLITKSALVLAACAGLNAFAGPAPAPYNPKAPGHPVQEEDGALFDTLGATLEVGYDSRYYYRGYWFADNTVWTGLSLSIPLTEQLTLGLGALYTGTAGTHVGQTDRGTAALIDSEFQYRELDLSASLTYDAGFAKIGLVYTHYEFFDTYGGTWHDSLGSAHQPDEFGVSGAEEVGVTIALPLGPVNFYAGAFHDFRIGGTYLEAGVDYPIEITSWLSLVPAVKGGYGLDYYSGVTGMPFVAAGGTNNPGAHRSGFTHLLVSLSAPMKLTRTATLTPYVAMNITGRARVLNNQNNEIFGGVKLGVTF